MSVVYGKLEMPEKVIVEESSPTFAKFIAEPFERGMGHTVGNSLRRLMLSALESSAIVSIMIEGIPHEFMAVDGIIEDMTNVVLNFKCALLRRVQPEEGAVRREKHTLEHTLEITDELLKQGNGQYKVTLGDLVKSPLYEVLNPELHLFTVTKPMTRKVRLRVHTGRGYVPSERIEVEDKVVDEIVIDAAFSPVRLVNYYVENTRVGQDTDFDRLVLEVTTDGRVSPEEALAFAAMTCKNQLDVFANLEVRELSFEEGTDEEASGLEEILGKLALGINEIELSVRSTNCLNGANIDTIGELVIMQEAEMLKFRNFGKKSLLEIKDKLSEMGLSFGMDLAPYGITRENIEDKVREYLENKKNVEV